MAPPGSPASKRTTRARNLPPTPAHNNLSSSSHLAAGRHPPSYAFSHRQHSPLFLPPIESLVNAHHRTLSHIENTLDSSFLLSGRWSIPALSHLLPSSRWLTPPPSPSFPSSHWLTLRLSLSLFLASQWWSAVIPATTATPTTRRRDCLHGLWRARHSGPA